jgi:hypothetical protein
MKVSFSFKSPNRRAHSTLVTMSRARINEGGNERVVQHSIFDRRRHVRCARPGQGLQRLQHAHFEIRFDEHGD